MDIRDLPLASPASCPNGQAILDYARSRGLADAGLVCATAFGWYLVSREERGWLVSDVAADCNILRGGGIIGAHQIRPETFQDPDDLRTAAEASLPRVRRRAGVTFRVFEDAGHPGSGEAGWSLMNADAESTEALDRFLEEAGRRHWAVWIAGEGQLHDAAPSRPGAILFKPRGARKPWQERTVAAPAKRGPYLQAQLR